MSKEQELLAAKIKSSGLKIGDWIGGWQEEAIGPIEGFELRGRNLLCIVAGKKYPVSEIYFCRSPEGYEEIISGFRKMKQEWGEPFARDMKEDKEARKKRLALEMRRRAEKKAMGRAKSGRTV